MPLREIRDLFLKASGRRSLATANGADNGADWYINAAHRLLDMLHEMPLNRHVVLLPRGGYIVTLRLCREVHQVWLDDATGRVRLKPALFEQLWGRMATQGDAALVPPVQNLALDARTFGAPCHYAPVPIGLAPDQNNADDGEDPYGHRLSLDAVMPGDHYQYRGVLIHPPSDAERALTVVGRFASPVLRVDTDKSFWSENHPELLIYAACAVHEKMQRNTEGSADWMAALRDGLGGLAGHITAEQSTLYTEMQG